jgi:hypothetical protein
MFIQQQKNLIFYRGSFKSRTSFERQPFIAAFAYGFNETGTNAKPISKVTDF